MNPILLIDFGSTYTKLLAVNPDRSAIIAHAESATTVQSDISNGFQVALDKLNAQLTDTDDNVTPLQPDDFASILACSSAAGGLRIIVSGLVAELTAEAARLAALGAGGKVLKVYARQLTQSDIREIESAAPDLFLLTGGTDGGESATILANAERLAASALKAPILIAGNRNAAEGCDTILRAAGKDVSVCPNVLPKLGNLNISPVQDEIRARFLQQIVYAKGLSRVRTILDDIIMPTPTAVLRALTLLANGTRQTPGIGPLMAIDLGGATCDVYSIADGSPLAPNTLVKGLPEPDEKRTVEGDIGMRISIHGIVEAVTIERVATVAELPVERIQQWIDEVSADPAHLPETPAEIRIDTALASLAVETATIRHAGTLSETYTPAGLTYIQEGKDLRNVTTLIFIGGALIRARDPENIAEFARASATFPFSLRPKNIELRIDRDYILSAMGLLAEENPELALRLMKKHLTS